MRDWLHHFWQQCLITVDETATKSVRAFGSAPQSLQSPSPLRLGHLEPRVLFSATPIDPALMDGADESPMVATVELPTSEESSQLTLDASNSLIESAPREVIVLDGAVEGIDHLLDDLYASDRHLEVFVLDSDRDGIDQITELLEGRGEIQALHLVSHGDSDSIQLGNVTLTSQNLDGYAGQIAGWKNALDTDADLLLYGCDLASSHQGELLVESLAALTGADVAASDDVTGHHSRGGDWELEFTAGSVESEVAFSTMLQQSWLSTLEVVTFQQGFDGYVSTIDTEIDSGDPTADNSSSDELDADGLPLRQILIRFEDIVGNGVGQIPAVATINSATLTVNVTGTTDDGTIELHQVLIPWSDTDSWNDLANGIQLDDVEAASVREDRLDDGDDAGSKVFNLDKSTIQKWVDGAPNYGWVIVNDDPDGWSIDSSEGGVAPILTVDYSLPAGFWITTKDDGNVASTQNEGLLDWDRGTVVGFGEPDLDLMPNGATSDASTTEGQFSSIFDISTFATNGDQRINAMHVVQTDTEIGSTTTFTVQTGDVLLSMRSSATLEWNGGASSLTVDPNDVFVFRPTAPGDYSDGEFFMLLDDFATENVHAISLVETDTVLGGTGFETTLNEGAFIYTDEASPTDVRYFDPDNVGPSVATTALVDEILLKGSDANLSEQIDALELIETTTSLGGTTLQSGWIVASINDRDDVGDLTELIDVEENDLIYFDVEKSERSAGDTDLRAYWLFDGSDVGLASSGEDITSLAFNSPIFNVAPIADAGVDQTISEGQDLTLDASGSYDLNGDLLTFTWDIDGDGQFDDASGENPTVSWSSLGLMSIPITDDGGPRAIRVQIDDGNGSLTTDTMLLTVENAAPTIVIGGGAAATEDGIYSIMLTASDPGDDTVSQWNVDWGDGTVTNYSGVLPPTFDHSYDRGGTYNILVSAVDEDGTWIQNNIFVTGVVNSDGQVFEFEANTGQQLNQFGSVGAFDGLTQVVVGPNGNLFVSSYDSRVIREFTQDGVEILNMGGPWASGLNRPTGMAFDANGNLWVAEFSSEHLTQLDGNGNVIRSIDLGFNASGIKFHPNGSLYLTDYWGGRLYEFDGEKLNPSPLGTGLGNPDGIAIHSDGTIFVTEVSNREVSVFDPVGGFVSSFSVEDENGVSMIPHGLEFGPDGLLYISSYRFTGASSSTDRIVRFEDDGGWQYLDDFTNGGMAGVNLDAPHFFTFLPEQQVTVSHVADTPTVTDALTAEDTQTTSGLVIIRNSADGEEVTHYKISNIVGGTLFHSDGSTVIAAGSFISAAQGKAGLKFTPLDNFVGTAGFDVQASLAANDAGLGGSVEAASITVTAVNDDPENLGTLPTDILAVSNTASDIDISSLNISDADALIANLTVTLTTSAGGTLDAASGTGVTVNGSGTDTLILEGSQTSLNNYFDVASNITFTSTVGAAGNNVDSIDIEISDNGNVGSGGGGTINLGTVNIDVGAIQSLPTNDGNLPSDVSVDEDTLSSVDLSAIHVSDIDAGTNPLTMTLSTGFGGRLSATSSGGVVVAGSGTAAITLTGTQDDLNAFLDVASNVQYVGIQNAYGDDADIIRVDVTDHSGASSGVNLGTVNVDIAAVNDDPTNAGSLPTDITTLQETPSAVDLSQIQLSDIDSASSPLMLTLSTLNGGKLSAAAFGGVTVGGTSTTMTLTGSQSNLNAFLNLAGAIQFTGGPDVFGNDADRIQVDVTDLGNIGDGGGGVISLGTVNVDILPPLIPVAPPSIPTPADPVPEAEPDSTPTPDTNPDPEPPVSDGADADGDPDTGGRTLGPAPNSDSDDAVAILPPEPPDELMESRQTTDFGSSESDAANLNANERKSIRENRTASESELQNSIDGTLSRLDLLIMSQTGAMWDQLDSERQRVDSHVQGDIVMVGVAGAAASSFSIGYVAWALRSGFLLSGLLAQLPAWQSFDTLSVMQGLTSGKKETLEQLVDRKAKRLRAKRA